MGMELAKALVDRIQSAPAMRAGRGSTAEGETHVQECVVVPMVLVEIEMQDPCVCLPARLDRQAMPSASSRRVLR